MTAFPFISGMAAEKGEPDKGSTEKITSALPFFTSDAVMAITSNQNIARCSSVHSGFEKDMALKHGGEASASTCALRNGSSYLGAKFPSGLSHYKPGIKLW